MAYLRVGSLCGLMILPGLMACAQTSLLPKTVVDAPLSLTTQKIGLNQNRAVFQEKKLVAAQTNIAEPIAPTYRSTERMTGFSADGRYFIYLESSRDTGAGVPKAALQIMDLTTNRCVPNGCFETKYGEPDAKLSLAEVENELLQRTQQLRQNLRLTTPVAGSTLPMTARSTSDGGPETATVQLNGKPLLLQIRNKDFQIDRNDGNPNQPRKSLILEAIYQGTQRSLGELGDATGVVLGYSVREVKLSANGKQVAVLVTAVRPTFEGTLATTLVRGFQI